MLGVTQNFLKSDCKKLHEDLNAESLAAVSRTGGDVKQHIIDKSKISS